MKPTINENLENLTKGQRITVETKHFSYNGFYSGIEKKGGANFWRGPNLILSHGSEYVKRGHGYEPLSKFEFIPIRIKSISKIKIQFPTIQNQT
tara:strand:+ start:890 stop:1171 length:282 start_codon:yes stop_codon:yes gene_type:complete